MQDEGFRVSGTVPPLSDGAGQRIVASVVIVCFRSGRKLGDCLASLGGGTGSPAGIEVIVVNNSSDDAEEIAAICARHGAIFRQSGGNLGFGGGCNAGAAGARGDVVMFVNPDVLVTPEDLSRLAALMGAHPDLVALGPLQQAPNGRIRAKRHAVGQPKPAPDADGAAPLMETRFLSGGALMVRRAAFERIGGFDDAIFLFHEDDDLCLRLAPLGRLAYARGVVVRHDWGTSTPPSAEATRFRLWHQGYSKVQVLRKHYGDMAARGALFEAFLKFVSPEMLTAKGRRKARAFLGGVRAALSRSSNGYVPQ
ncbi:MAG: hypothetical protein RIR62_1846 [Pseudomonadota bacterium]|jgi:GT2 family glycosyltransferase